VLLVLLLLTAFLIDPDQRSMTPLCVLPATSFRHHCNTSRITPVTCNGNHRQQALDTRSACCNKYYNKNKKTKYLSVNTNTYYRRGEEEQKQEDCHQRQHPKELPLIFSRLDDDGFQAAKEHGWIPAKVRCSGVRRSVAPLLNPTGKGEDENTDGNIDVASSTVNPVLPVKQIDTVLAVARSREDNEDFWCDKIIVIRNSKTIDTLSSLTLDTSLHHQDQEPEQPTRAIVHGKWIRKFGSLWMYPRNRSDNLKL